MGDVIVLGPRKHSALAKPKVFETIDPKTAPKSAPHYIFAQAQRKYIVGCDLGQSTDPTALCVLEHRIEPTDQWAITERDCAPSIKRQQTTEHFDVRYLQRLPLGLPYPAISNEVARLISRPPLSEGCELVVDETGVGRAVADIFERDGMRPHRVTITAGLEAAPAGFATPGSQAFSWHVPKAVLISTLDARLHVGELKFAASLNDAEALKEELTDFRRKVSAAGRYSYEARVGKHDDLVLAVALALWWITGRPKPPVAAKVLNYGIV